MALTKISRGLLSTGISDSSDATAITIDSSENVGIGDTSPSTKLDITGVLRLGGTSSTDQGTQLNLYSETGGNGHMVAYQLVFDTGSNNSRTERMRIDSSGNVGIGTSSPTGKLEIAATGTNAAPHIKLVESGDTREFNIYNDGSGNGRLVLADSDDDTSDTEIVLADNGNIQFKTATSERMLIDSSGNVQVGASSVANCLIGNDGDLINIKSKKDGTDAIPLTFMTQASGGALAERMRIDSGGHLLVGTTSEYSGTSGNITAPLQIDIGANDTNSKYVFVNRSASTGVIGGFKAGVTGFSTMGRVELKADNVVGGAQSSSFHVYTTLNATEAQKMQIDSNGHVYFTSLYGSAADQNDVRYNASSGLLFYNTSSRRYKENIKDMPDGVLDKIKQARVVTFDEKGTDVSSYGLIAEELDELIPELVTKKEIDGELVPDSIVYSKIGVWVLKAIQEQQTQIEAMQLEIDNLKKS